LQLPEIAFVGRSNVGKSSLINAVSGVRALARVSKTPGKTRACNVYDVDGRWYLVDLPGYGFARASDADRAGFRRLLESYVSEREHLSGVVWLLDIRRDVSDEDLVVAERFADRGVPVLGAITKADKLPRGQRTRRAKAIMQSLKLPENQVVVTSALSGEGVEDLRDSIEALTQK
jgi:GTP-binding protein